MEQFHSIFPFNNELPAGAREPRTLFSQNPHHRVLPPAGDHAPKINSLRRAAGPGSALEEKPRVPRSAPSAGGRFQGRLRRGGGGSPGQGRQTMEVFWITGSVIKRTIAAITREVRPLFTPTNSWSNQSSLSNYSPRSRCLRVCWCALWSIKGKRLRPGDNDGTNDVSSVI